MKNYIAPEMEIVKFSAEDIMNGSTGNPVVTDEIKQADNSSYTYGAAATHIDF